MKRIFSKFISNTEKPIQMRIFEQSSKNVYYDYIFHISFSIPFYSLKIVYTSQKMSTVSNNRDDGDHR